MLKILCANQFKHIFVSTNNISMKRTDFIKLMALAPLTLGAMNLSSLSRLGEDLTETDKMPVLFIGHGSPMNAIEENEFVAAWRAVAKNLPSKPRAILCISAHWETKGTMLTAMQSPKTIHDFGGFPQALFDVQYKAQGSPELAKEAQALLLPTAAGLDYSWGFDHGAWSIAHPMFPQADVPMIQMSLDYTLSPEKHIELGKQLSALRRKGILIIGSGNIVHNLRTIDWNNPNGGYDWAQEANTGIKTMIEKNELSQLAKAQQLGQAYKLSIPTLDHYLPLMYVLGLRQKDESVSFFNDRTVMGSISMTSVKVG